MTKLTENFTLEEISRGVKLNKTQTNTATKIAKLILQPIRDKFGVTTVTSGARSISKNKESGGVSNSWHLYEDTHGAVDIVTEHNINEVFEWCKKNIVYDKIILEHNDLGNIWIHIQYSTNEKENRKLCFTSKEVNGEMQYKLV